MGEWGENSKLERNLQGLDISPSFCLSCDMEIEPDKTCSTFDVCK